MCDKSPEPASNPRLLPKSWAEGGLGGRKVLVTLPLIQVQMLKRMELCTSLLRPPCLLWTGAWLVFPASSRIQLCVTLQMCESI